MTVALVTGVNGFVGPHLRAFLEKNNFEVYGIERKRGIDGHKNTVVCNILDFDELSSII